MSFFSDIDDANVAPAEDRVAAPRGPLPSGVYPATVKAAWGGRSKSGAKSLTLILTLEGGREFKTTVYTTTKEGKTYSVRKNDPKKTQNPLDGFTVANDICLLTTGKPLKGQPDAERVFNVYDFEQRKEVPTKVPMLVDLVGKSVIVGIVLQMEDKNEQNAAGEWVPSAFYRKTNEIKKVFHADTRKTVTEYRTKVDKAVFIDKYTEAYGREDYVADARKNKDSTEYVREEKASDGNGGSKASATAPQAPEAEATDSLFV